MKMKDVYILLCFIGLVLPTSQFVLFTLENGLAMMLFTQQAFANHASSFIAADLFVTALASIAFILAEGSRLKMKRLWIPIAAVFAVGISLALPVFLYMRELQLEKKQ